MSLEIDRKERNSIPSLECNCANKKKIKVMYDGGFGDRFIVEYCEECYEKESKEFMISMEVLF